jgi:hypothetical protein
MTAFTLCTPARREDAPPQPPGLWSVLIILAAVALVCWKTWPRLDWWHPWDDPLFEDGRMREQTSRRLKRRRHRLMRVQRGRGP